MTALIPEGVSVSVSLDGGKAINIEGPDGLEGVTTIGNSESMSTTALFASGLIQRAVDNADPGDTIFLWPKTYYDNVDVYKDLKIRGWVPLLTVVDGQEQGSVFTIDPGVTATISDMTIRRGSGSNYYESTDATAGGGIYNSGTLTLKGCNLIGNTADIGGGLFSDYYGNLILDGCKLLYNHANFGGGAINTEGSTLIVRNCNILDNTADDFGGGIVNWGSTVTVTNSQIIGNAAGLGGGIWTWIYGTTTMDRCSINNNRAIGSGTDYKGDLLGYGGGVYNRGRMSISYCTLTNNFASNGGGAIYTPGTLTQKGNFFARNTPDNIEP